MEMRGFASHLWIQQVMEMRRLVDLDIWLPKAAELLARNRITVDGHRYTAPSLDTGDFGRKDYANQFMWDSCFHAIIWRWIDPEMAQDELLSLTSRQVTVGPDAGMIPHCNYWRGGGDWLWRQPDRSSITPPPLLATASNLVFRCSNNRSFLNTIYPKIGAYHDWFDRRRDPDQDGLVCIIHPWEAGGDVLPRWDRGMGFIEFSHENGRNARLELAHILDKYATDPLALAENGLFHVEPMDFNAIRAADLDAMTEIARTLDRPEEAANWQHRAETIREAFRAKMIVDGLPYDLEGLDERPIVQASAGQFITLFGGCPTPEQAQQLVKQLQEPRFWTPFPVPTSPTDAETFAPEIYWRGNVWPCVNWLIYQGLCRYGYFELAHELAARSLSMLEQSGFWEYYHPLTGQGFGGANFGWAAVMLDTAASILSD
jgi:glycogen debranching enzyme